MVVNTRMSNQSVAEFYFERRNDGRAALVMRGDGDPLLWIARYDGRYLLCADESICVRELLATQRISGINRQRRDHLCGHCKSCNKAREARLMRGRPIMSANLPRH